MKDSYIFYKDKLRGEYKTVFEQVEMYVSMQNIDESTLEERLGDLLDIFLSAQDAEKPVHMIIGNSIEQFCKTFCSDFGIQNKILRVLDFLKSIAWFFVIISVIDILWLLPDMIGSGDVDLWHSIGSLNISMYFTAIIIFSVFFSLTHVILRHMMFKTKRISMRVLKAVAWVEIIVSFVGILLIITFCKASLFDAPTWIVTSISCLYLLIYYPLFGKRNKRQKIKFSDLVGTETQTEISSYMDKRFEKAKKKNLKKGKGELTLEAFLDQEEKSCNQIGKLRLFYISLPIIITVLAYLLTYSLDGFESTIDSFIFIGIMLAVEYSLMFGLWKTVKHGVKTRRLWIKSKRNEMEQINDIESCD